MARTVPIVGKRRVKPSVYLRPIAQAISQRPATMRKSQAMGMPLKCLNPVSNVFLTYASKSNLENL
jgi:hypothetical protein